MQQIKIFKGIESDLAFLEKQVNAWLKESGVHVRNIFGNISPQSAAADPETSSLSKGIFSPSDILLVVVFETTEEA